jgi:hypothetical protein
MVTVIPEGDYHEFFGWATPGLNKFSYWRTFVSKLLPAREYMMDTNMHGGHRAFVVTGHYENVLPMDIYPVLLLKAILAGDVELMENLGIMRCLRRISPCANTLILQRQRYRRSSAADQPDYKRDELIKERASYEFPAEKMKEIEPLFEKGGRFEKRIQSMTALPPSCLFLTRLHRREHI